MIPAPGRAADASGEVQPNGPAIDPRGRTLHVADSHKGTIWAVRAAGTARLWLTDQALAPVPDAECARIAPRALRHATGS